MFLLVSFYLNSAINIVLIFSAIIGNILALMTLKSTFRIQPSSKALYCSLAVSDFGLGVFVQPMFVGRLLAGRQGLTGLCRMFGVMIDVAGVVTIGVSLQTLSAISLDRLFAILLKMRYREFASVRRVRLVLLLCWFFSSFHAAMFFVSPAFFIAFQVLGIFMCAGVCTVSYVIIFRTLCQLQNQVQNYGPGAESEQNAFSIARFKKSLSSALWVYGFLIACYVPFMLVLLAKMSMGPNATNLGIQWFTVTLLYLNSSLNPILYCWKIPEVRQSMKDILEHLYCFPNNL